MISNGLIFLVIKEGLRFVTMDLQQLNAHLPTTYTTADRAIIEKAYILAESAHKGQVRAKKQPYVTHCVGVAIILADMEVAPSLVVAGLLHDIVIDTDISLDMIKNEFGDTVVKIHRWCNKIN